MPDHPSQQRAPPTDTPGRYRPHQSSRKVLPMSSYHVESPGRVWKFMVGDLACPQPCTNGLLCICQKVNFGGFGAAQIMDDIGARCWSTIAQGKNGPEHLNTRNVCRKVSSSISSAKFCISFCRASANVSTTLARLSLRTAP